MITGRALKRKIRSLHRRFRQARMVARALKCPRQPIVAHIIPVRRCNLSCAYCNEYDNFSKPVPTAEMFARLDLLSALGTGTITISGGEPLLHPDLDRIIRAIRKHGIIATLITNGYLLTPERIKQLNRAGLEHMQISVDNVVPDGVSKKSLKVLEQKLRWLAQYAEFDVSINSVLGGGIRNPEDALTIARRAREHGLEATIGIAHGHSGQLLPLNRKQRSVYERIVETATRSFWTFAYYNQFQKNLVQGLPNDWHCRAGSRYLYVCEDGLVHYCSQQRGYPAVPLENYTREDLEREYHTRKPCAPYCTIACVHQVAMIDFLRERPLEALTRFFPPQKPTKALNLNLPLGVKILSWFFPPETRGVPQGMARNAVRGVALKILGIQ